MALFRLIQVNLGVHVRVTYVKECAGRELGVSRGREE